MSLDVSTPWFGRAWRMALPAITPPRPLLSAILTRTLSMSVTMLTLVSVTTTVGVLCTPRSWATDPTIAPGISEIYAVHSHVPKPVRLLTVPPIAHVVAPAATDTEQARESQVIPHMATLYKTAGVVLAAGTVMDKSSPGRRGTPPLTGYRLEALPLSQGMRATVQGKEAMVHTAWRLTITGGPFPVRAMPAMLWIGDTMVGYGQEASDLSTIAAVTFDETVLTEGATIALSYDEHGQRARFPHPLTFGQNRQ